DFYVLSLAWSPSYCALHGPGAPDQQCGEAQDRAFIVHGLWPQFEHGYPESCENEHPQRVPYALLEPMLDIMPSSGLIGHQWRKHGTCTGLDQEGYLRATRQAFHRIAVPEALSDAQTERRSDPE